MTTEEVAQKLVGLCKEGRYPEAYDMYAEDAISVEMDGWVAGKQITKGKSNILEGFNQWQSNIQEMHGGSVGDPVVAGNHFVVPMTSDVTFKQGGRVQMDELCVYEVANGQIKKAQFFYEVPQQ
ncbi:MAG: hypothetical protein ACJART_002533 [Maribacter sp.]|jgi:hypothetical protein|tara:strand:+ start:965 stop:1336 length:372 start_codon:yes stop_codon:yes gene_type:complete